MDNKISTTVIYYLIAICLALAASGTLIVALDWPLLAEIPLAAAIFIHLTAISKSLFTFWSDHQEQLVENLVQRIKSALFTLDPQEEEVNV